MILIRQYNQLILKEERRTFCQHQAFAAILSIGVNYCQGQRERTEEKAAKYHLKHFSNGSIFLIYEGLLRTLDIYSEIRCGLAHAYMIDSNADIDMGNIGCIGQNIIKLRKGIHSGLELILMNSRRLSIVTSTVWKEEQKAWISLIKL